MLSTCGKSPYSLGEQVILPCSSMVQCKADEYGLVEKHSKRISPKIEAIGQVSCCM